MPPLLSRILRRRFAISLGLFLLLAFIAINTMAYMQARAMTHFVGAETRTLPPEQLSLLGRIGVLLTGVQIPRPVNFATPADAGLVYQTFRFGGPHADDCEAWFIPAAGVSLGFCIQFHGYTSCKSSLLSSAKAFHDMGYDLLLVDFHGSGGSRGDQTTLGYREADDVAAAVAFARRQWSPATLILYGQSMGGAAILRAVGELNVQPSAVIIESVFDRLLSAVDDRFHAMGMPAFPLANLLVFWGGRQQGYNAFKLNPADYALKVTCPVLMFQGGVDPRVTTAQARNLFNNLAGPKQFELFEKSGHCAFLDDNRPRWTAAITDFLAKYSQLIPPPTAPAWK